MIPNSNTKIIPTCQEFPLDFHDFLQIFHPNMTISRRCSVDIDGLPGIEAGAAGAGASALERLRRSMTVSVAEAARKLQRGRGS